MNANRKADSDLKAHLDICDKAVGRKPQPGYFYKSIWEFGLKEFRFYQPSKLTGPELSHVKSCLDLLGFKPRPRKCFYNSQMLAMHDHTGEIKYVEGYAMNVIPVLHGWCEINGKVVDFTWRDENKDNFIGTFPDELAYAGVVIPNDTIMKAQLKTGHASTVLDDYENGWPMFSREFVR